MLLKSVLFLCKVALCRGVYVEVGGHREADGFSPSTRRVPGAQTQAVGLGKFLYLPSLLEGREAVYLSYWFSLCLVPPKALAQL